MHGARALHEFAALMKGGSIMTWSTNAVPDIEIGQQFSGKRFKDIYFTHIAFAAATAIVTQGSHPCIWFQCSPVKSSEDGSYLN